MLVFNFQLSMHLMMWSAVKDPPANSGDRAEVSGLGRFPGRGHGDPLQFSCLENATD